MNPEPIFECFTAYQKTAAMQASVDIGLFSAVAAGHAKAPAIARACEASPKGVRVLCDYWVVHGLMTKAGEAYLEPINTVMRATNKGQTPLKFVAVQVSPPEMPDAVAASEN